LFELLKIWDEDRVVGLLVFGNSNPPLIPPFENCLCSKTEIAAKGDSLRCFFLQPIGQQLPVPENIITKPTNLKPASIPHFLFFVSYFLLFLGITE
jgi:hypothetical protein